MDGMPVAHTHPHPVHIDVCVHTLAVYVHIVISYVGPVPHTDMDKRLEGSS